MAQADTLVINIGELVTPPASARALHGAAMRQLTRIPGAALAIRGGRILAAADEPLVRAAYRADEIIDAGGCSVVPGFVDPHTHAVWAGERVAEFEQRISGVSYMEIMAAGGGILSTVQATRAADLPEIINQTRPRLQRMLAHGTTTAEVKTGYGLSTEAERKLLDAIHLLDEDLPLDLVPTLLGAHAVPPEFRHNPDAYVDLIIEEMLPDLAYMLYTVELADGRSYEMRAAQFCDVFCERGVFDVAQTKRILQAAKAHGLGLKLHVDEFEPMGGTTLAVGMGAASVDHIVRTGEEELRLLAASETVGVALPGTPFGLGSHHFAPARQLIDLDGSVALATDLNPGTSWCESMPMIMAIAARFMRLTPAECLTAATLNAAHAVGLGQHVGALAANYQADFLLLDTDDYRDLTYRYGGNLVSAVYKRGMKVV